MSDYIRLPRSALTENITRDPNLAMLLLYLLGKMGQDGKVSVNTTELCRVYGWSRQQSRTLLCKIKATAGLTTLPTANATTLMFEGQKDTPRKQPLPQPPKQPQLQPLKRNDGERGATQGALVFEPPVHGFVDPVFEDAFTAWLDYKKKQFRFEYKTERSLKAAYADLVRLSGGDPYIATRIVEQSMSNGWKGLFELKSNGTQPITTTDNAASRKAQRDRGLSLATEIVARSENLLSLFNGSGNSDSDTCKNQE